MPQKIILLPGIGEVVLTKRRGAKNIRLSVTSAGKVRVSMPPWSPYSAGIRFAKTRAEWLEQQLSTHNSRFVENGDRIGKSHRLEYQRTTGTKVSSRVTATAVIIKSGLPLNTAAVQDKISAAAERALALEAKTLLPQRLDRLADKYGYSYNSLKIKKLTSRWGSCSSKKDISLSYFLMQLPWDLIDYVLVHELVHTRHMNHSQDFWAEMVSLIPDTTTRRKEIKNHKPSLRFD